jgi:hypothetical protein
VSAPGPVGVDDRDFPPSWHLKVVALSAAVLAVALPLAFKLFLP